MSEQEKKDKRFGMIISGSIHACLILIFFFLVAWREPDPPIPEYGIELNLGFQEEGGGDTERDAQALVEDTEAEETPDAPEETEQVETTEEAVVEETTPPITETATETEKAEEVVEQETEEVIEDPVTAETSEVAVEKKKETEEVKKEETPPVVEKKEEEKPVEEPKKPDPRAIMGGKKTNTENTDQTSNNQGDNPALMGNQGDKDGQESTAGDNVDGGLSYSLQGWNLVKRNVDQEDSQVEGKIVFDIEVDDTGRVVQVTLKPGADSSISDLNVVEFYRRQVGTFTFEQKDRNKVFNGLSKGTVTIVIKNN